MNVLVDTSVWSLVLRRIRTQVGAHARELTELIEEERAAIIGPIRQELLSGIRDPVQFESVRHSLRDFPDLLIGTADYERAAMYYNHCRGRGIQGSNTDFLICAVASRREMAIFTTDKDFGKFAEILEITLHLVR